MKWVRHEIPIFEVVTYFCISAKTRDVERRAIKEGYRIAETHSKALHSDVDGVVIPLFKGNKEAAYLLWLPKVPRLKKEYNYLTHELLHLMKYIWDHIGLHNGIPNEFDEIEAHMMGYLMETFKKFMQK